jgi:hypothetical protein
MERRGPDEAGPVEGRGSIGRGWLLLGAAPRAPLGVLFGFAGAVAVALQVDDVGVVDDAFDESRGAGGVGEDRAPVPSRPWA